MGIYDLYIGIGQQRNLSHFANIVRIAKSDDQISPEEIEFLAKVSKKYNISNEQFRDIIKFPEKVPTIAHLDCVERIERLYDLLIMVKADHHVEDQEVFMLRRIVTGLAFPLNRVDMVVDHSIAMEMDGVTVDSFTDSILKLLKMKQF
ncbi:MAG: TerB family tellurite resistance protein [Flavobacteriales bacterium]|nr:TerB family tellurite resistance protein [Flavobacteriales bacterium]